MAAAYTHVRTIEFVETDLAGIVHYSNYFRFMESAETAFLRSLGFALHDPEADYAWPRVQVSCRFERPARFADELETRLYVAQVGRSSVEYGFDLSVGGRRIAQGGYTVVHTQRERSAVALPDGLRARLVALVDPRALALRLGEAKELGR